MIDRKFTRSRYVHQHKYHQINKGQFLHGKRIIPVYHKKSHSHCKDHRDHSQTIKRTEYKAYGTKYLTENSQPQRQRTSYTQWIRERFRHDTKIRPFLDTMRKQQYSEKDTQRQQKKRKSISYRLGRKKEIYKPLT